MSRYLAIFSLFVGCSAGGLLVAEPLDGGSGGAGGAQEPADSGATDGAEDGDARLPPPEDASPVCWPTCDGGDG